MAEADDAGGTALLGLMIFGWDSTRGDFILRRVLLKGTCAMGICLLLNRQQLRSVITTTIGSVQYGREAKLRFFCFQKNLLDDKKFYLPRFRLFWDVFRVKTTQKAIYRCWRMQWKEIERSIRSCWEANRGSECPPLA